MKAWTLSSLGLRPNRRAIAPVIRGLNPSEFVRVMSVYNRGKVRCRVVRGELCLAATDMLTDELMMTEGGHLRMKGSARRWFKKNCKAFPTKIGRTPLLVVPASSMREFSTYVYHKSQGVDFRACFSSLPEVMDDGLNSVWDSNTHYDA